MSQVEAAKSTCILRGQPQLNPAEYLKPGPTYDKISEFLTQQDESSRTMKVPVSIFQGDKDQASVSLGTTKQIIVNFCSRGASILYNEYQDKDHSTVLMASQEDAFSFAEAAFGEIAPQNAC